MLVYEGFFLIKAVIRNGIYSHFGTYLILVGSCTSLRFTLETKIVFNYYCLKQFHGGNETFISSNSSMNNHLRNYSANIECVIFACTWLKKWDNFFVLQQIYFLKKVKIKLFTRKVPSPCNVRNI